MNGLRIDLGCGHTKHSGFFGIDCQALPGVDLVADANDIIPLQDNCADYILSHNFHEHIRIDKRIHIMEECWRLLAPGGVLEVLVPDATVGPGFAQDPTHYSPWCVNSFKYYTEDIYRKLYDIKAKFSVIDLRQDIVTGASMGVVYVYFKGTAIK